MEATPRKMSLLPAAPGTCSVCATAHDPANAHNYWSLHYQVHFKMRYGRDATHADTVAHLTPEQADNWKQVALAALVAHGQTWTEPPEGEDPIAEPYASL